MSEPPAPRPPVLSAPEHTALFPTRVWTFEVSASERLNDELAALIEEHSRARPSFARGERTGWQSDDGFFDWSDAAGFLRHIAVQAVMALHPSVAAAVTESGGLDIRGWANLLRAGDYFTPHTHAGAAWSGVYWVEAGDSSEQAGGMFAVRDPRAGANMIDSPLCAFDSACTAYIAPVTGRMLVFPSWLVHWVTPYRGDRRRISVSFNVR